MYDEDAPYGNQLHDKTVTIINRSEVVGRPLAALLANDGAKVCSDPKLLFFTHFHSIVNFQVYSIDISDVLLFHRGDELELNKYKVEDCDLKLEDILPQSDVVITGVPSPDYRVPIDLLKGKLKRSQLT